MKQAVHFSGKHFINVSGIPEEFWQEQDWTVTALLKFGEFTTKVGLDYSYIPVLGIGNIDKSHGLRLGIRGSTNHKQGQSFHVRLPDIYDKCFCFCVA